MSDPSNSPRQQVTQVLHSPVQFGSELVTQLVYQPVTGKLLRTMPLPGALAAKEGMPADWFLELASRMTGYPSLVFDLLDGADALAAIGVVNTMMSPSAGTGDKS